MQTSKKYLPFFASALLMCVVLFIIYPRYQYYIDPDGTAYLTISKRYASGDFARAINGYWSPWSCWLTAILIKAGISAIPASVIINSIGAIGFLSISHSFFLKFNIINRLQWLMDITLACFLCYAIFWQSFDDLWECFFLLSTLRLMLSDEFSSKPALWAGCGIVGALAYFAKAYSFPFFILNTICCTYFICRENKTQWLKISCTAITVMTACSLPWICLLHNKYGIWTTATAGSLNTSWYLVGHPHWKEGIVALLPPPYPDSPYYWEDPYFVNGATPHFWESFSLFRMQLIRIAYNLYKYVNSMTELSVFFTAVWLISLGIVFIKKIRSYFPPGIFIAAVSFSLFPLGYFLINFEGRYLWYMLPLSLVTGSIALQQISESLNNRKLSDLLFLLFAFSYLIYPAIRLNKMYQKGADDFIIAKCLANHNIKGAFTAEANARDVQKIARIAYFSGSQYYNLPAQFVSADTLYREIERYKLKFFLYYPDYYNSHEGAYIINNPHLENDKGIPLPEFVNDSITGLKVFLVNQ